MWFVLNISANATASSIPIGLWVRCNLCSVLFKLIALANWSAPSESMLQVPSSRWTRVWFVLSIEASEMMICSGKCGQIMTNVSSVVLWWSPLMISSKTSGERALSSIERFLRLVDDDSSSHRARQSSTPIFVSCDDSDSLSCSSNKPNPSRWGMSGIRLARSVQVAESDSSRMKYSHGRMM